LVLAGCGYNRHGVALRVVCNDRSHLWLEYGARQRPLEFILGPSEGYRLAWAPRDRPPLDLYNDGLSPQRSGLNDYVGWNYRAASGATAQPTYTFAPLPSNANATTMRVFERPARRYDPSAEPWRHETPPFMNIFLDPAIVGRPDFDDIAGCLAEHQDEINAALAHLGTRLGRYYFPLRLGGVVLGRPPYGDPSYTREARELWGDEGGVRKLPAVGRLTLYDGEVAQGSIDGHLVRLSIQDGQRDETLDGAPFNLGVVGAGNCTNDLQRCAKLISAMSANIDGSMTYDIAVQTNQSYFVSELPKQ